MKTVINSGRKAGKENHLEACDGFCHDSSRIALDEFRNSKEEPPYLSFEITLLLGCSILSNSTFNFSLNQQIQKNLQTKIT